MNRRMASVMTWMLFGLILSAGPVRAQSVEATYQELYGQREDQIHKQHERVAFARELLSTAKNTSHHGMKVHLCRKAYEWGSRDLAGYSVAAEALDILQRESPEDRVWCLEGLRKLYDDAYTRNPNKLRLGTGLAEVLLELAEQRVQDARMEFETGDLTAKEALAEFRAAVGEVQRAHSLYSGTVRRAESDAKRAQRLGKSQIAKSLNQFIDEFTPHVRQTEARLEDLRDEQSHWTRLVAARGRFDASPNQDNATQVAATYIMDFDRPELIEPHILEHLPRSVRQPVKLACQPLIEISAGEAAALTNWYIDLMTQADNDVARRHLVIRARLYARRAQALGHDQADKLRSKVRIRLLASGLADEADVDRRVRQLHARLHYQFGSGEGEPPAFAATPGDPHPGENNDDPATTVASDRPAEVTAGQDDPPAGDGREKHAGPPNDAVAVADQHRHVSASDSPNSAARTSHSGKSNGGRPMAICDVCGRKFFPGWGVKTHTCPDCRSGRRNIFDFGRD